MGTSATNSKRNDGVIYHYDDDLVTAIDIASGVASNGKTKAEALGMLAEALELHEGGGEPVTDEDAVLRELGLDPDEINRARDDHREQELPDVLQ